MYFDDGSVRTFALEMMGFELLGEIDPFLDQGLHVARTVFAPFRVVADEDFERVSRFEAVQGKLEEFEEALIEGDEIEVRIGEADALMDIVQGRFQDRRFFRQVPQCLIPF